MTDITNILSNLDIEKLNAMQEATIKAFPSNKNLVVLSPTGSGKTLAILLPLTEHLEKISNERNKGMVKAIILAPSRELAQQIDSVFKTMKTGFTSVCCYGGRPAMDEHRLMNNLHPDILISTPGRMTDHMRKDNFDTTFVDSLIIDEFDKSLELGFLEEMSEVVSQLPNINKHILLSATDSEDIPEFLGLGKNGEKMEIKKLSFESGNKLEERLKIHITVSPEKDKLETLGKLLCSRGYKQTIVFVNYRESVERVEDYLKKLKLPVTSYHGGMQQEAREKALYRFSNGSSPILVSTDLAARGLDISGIDQVIHYHLPLNEETFTHRNGRTARWDKEGTAFVIISAQEEVADYISSAATAYEITGNTDKPFKSKWDTIYIGKGKKDKLSKIDIVGFLYKKGGLSKEDIGKIDVRDHYVLAAVRRSKVKQLLKLVSGEKIKGMKTIIEIARV